MKEYAGFKVGDKVEITGHGSAIVGKITSFGDRKLGGCMEPDTLEVWINEILSFDLLCLMRRELIKKLPKYAVGDVVRVDLKGVRTSNFMPCEDYQDKLFTIGAIDREIHSFSDDPYPDNKCKFLEKYLMPFDGFRIGDTVWTEKRGKGRIVDETIFCLDPERPFVVRFENEAKDRCPKIYSMFPTEQKMKEARKGSGIVYQCPAIPYNPALIRTTVCIFSDGGTKPKFKVGDVVYCSTKYFGMKKWVVEELRGNRCVIRSGAHSIDSMPESDLRLWKETKFKGCVAGHGEKNP
jgi:ribosomal protein L21E